MVLRQQQSRGINVAPRDMRMDIKGAGHDDFAAGIIGLVGVLVWHRRNNASVPDPNIANLIALIYWVNDVASVNFY
jgi:hypothetical protein